MAHERFSVGVVVECRPLKSRWADHAWLPVAVIAGVPEAAPWTLLGEEAGVQRFYAGAFDVDLYRAETAGYRDNLESGAPKLWIAAHATGVTPPLDILVVTADPNEGAAYTEAGDNIVEAVPMPDQVAGVIARFVAEHHVERAFIKRRRDRADPDALALRPGRDKEGGEP